MHGVARLHHDPKWLTAVVHRLTEFHESRRTDGSDRWAVSDAPADFIAQQLKAIVGLSVSIDRVDAKQKLSANRSEPDRAGVIEGLSATLGSPTRMIQAMAHALEVDHEQ